MDERGHGNREETAPLLGGLRPYAFDKLGSCDAIDTNGPVLAYGLFGQVGGEHEGGKTRSKLAFPILPGGLELAEVLAVVGVVEILNEARSGRRAATAPDSSSE